MPKIMVKEVALGFRGVLTDELSRSQQGWLGTERAMQQAALKSVLKLLCAKQNTWQTPVCHNEINQIIEQIRRLTRFECNGEAENRKWKQQLSKLHRTLKNCIMRHKNVYRLKAANTAVRCRNADEEALALEVIRKRQDLSLQKVAPPKPAIE